MLLGLLEIRIVIFYMIIVLCVFYLAEKREIRLLGLLVLRFVLLCMTIVLCFYLTEERQAACLVNRYFVLCHFI